MKKSFCLIVFTLLCNVLFAQDQKDNVPRLQKLCADNSSWTSVLGGKAICAPKKTSYGFAVLTDGKMISACSEKGVKLWEQGVPGHPEPYLTVFANDFLLTVSDSCNLSLINPSGLTLWTKEVPFKIVSDPYVGRDSRIIVKGEKNLACFGVNGICKWILETDQLNETPLLELNDGTILCLLEKTHDGKSSAIRVTPFGEIIENINFTGFIQSALSCQNGVLLSFKGGGAGMCSVRDNATSTKWSIPYTDRSFSNTSAENGSMFVNLSPVRSALIVSGSGNVKTRVLIFSTLDGHVSDWFNVDSLFRDIKCCAETSDCDSIFFCDSKHGMVYDTEGNLIWNALLPESPDIFSRWNFLTFTKGNYLVICSVSWAMAGFRTTYKLSGKIPPAKNKKSDYRNFYKINTSAFEYMNLFDKIDLQFTGQNRQNELKQGLYGGKEADYVSNLLSLNQAYSEYLLQSAGNSVKKETSVFNSDQQGMLDVLMQYSLLGIDTFSPLIANIIKNEKDSTNFQSMLKSVSTFGYDPDGSILKAIEGRTRKMNGNDTSDLILVCDSVYEICRFMGRPALYSKGMEILTQLLYPQYDSKVREYARNTLTKIARLKI